MKTTWTTLILLSVAIGASSCGFLEQADKALTAIDYDKIELIVTQRLQEAAATGEKIDTKLLVAEVTAAVLASLSEGKPESGVPPLGAAAGGGGIVGLLGLVTHIILERLKNKRHRRTIYAELEKLKNGKPT